MNIFRAARLPALVVSLLTGCAVTSHPDYKPMVQMHKVSAQQLQAIEQQFKAQGLVKATVTTDLQGRVVLDGTYEDERQVERAFEIARAVVGSAGVSSVRPANIALKDWEANANAAFAKFVEDLARKYKMSVGVELVGAEKLISVNNTHLDGVEQFASGSVAPTRLASEFYGQLARQMSKGGGKRILIVGHTDDVGDSAANAQLSERRAEAIGKLFSANGVAASQIYYQGAGETLPIANNRDESGRARNRRVEIVDLSNETAFRAYLDNRKPTLAYYRPASPAIVSGGHAKNTKTDTASSGALKGPQKSSQPSKTEAIARTEKPTQNKGASTSPPVAVDSGRHESAKRPSGISGGGSTTSSDLTLRKSASQNAFNINFGGRPVGNNSHSVEIGKLSTNRSISIFPTAYASDEAPVGNCMQDRPRISHGVKSLRDGKEYVTSEYLPGVYDTSWAGLVNGHLVALTHVAVLRDGGSPSRNPELFVYRDYKGDRNAKPDHTGSPEVNTYRGEKALLYRVFASGPIRCMDIVFPNTKPGEAPDSMLYYEWGQLVHSTPYTPKLAK